MDADLIGFRGVDACSLGDTVQVWCRRELNDMYMCPGLFI